MNLRKGGTTHPFLTLQFLCDGEYDWQSNRFTARSGARKCLVASDHIEGEELRLLELGDLFDICVRHRLHYDHSRQKGIILHMLASLGDRGRFGLTAVGDDPAEADAIYRRTEEIFLSEAKAASA